MVDVMTLPDHLKPIEPAAAAHAVCERIATEAPGYQHGVAAKFYAFMETRAPHDGRRLAHALRHVLKRPDLAAEVEALLPPVPRPPGLDGILHMQSSGRWAIWQSDREPIEISCGELFHVEVEGLKGLQPTRMEHAHGRGYYALAGYPLRDGLHAALGDGDR